MRVISSVVDEVFLLGHEFNRRELEALHQQGEIPGHVTLYFAGRIAT